MNFKKTFAGIISLLFIIPFLTGCGAVGAKTASISSIYGFMAVLSALILAGYLFFASKKQKWFLWLFSSIFIVNTGYYLLSISKTLESALWANRISYLGSVFLPMFMFLIIVEATKLKTPKWLPWTLAALGIVVFLVAASPGFSDIYYKEVRFQKVDGITVLDKTYGDWHKIYLFYLLGYFGTMVWSIVHGARKKNLGFNLRSVVLITAVFVNICVWFIEQLVRIDFEILSFSYIISELFLLAFNLIISENERLRSMVENQTEKLKPQETKQISKPEPQTDESPKLSEKELENFLSGLEELTKTELAIFNAYTEGKTTKDVMAELDIKENTVKFHNKNIYNKLGVSSRKQMLEFYNKTKQ